jgi:hypothetical protein
MGTRSTTLFTETCERKSKNLLAIYRQMDGYPEGHGKDLANILNSFTFVNGLPFGDPRKLANGPGCAVAQILSELKDGPGGIYVIPCDKKLYDNDYHYHINFKVEDTMQRKVEVNVKVYSYRGTKPIFRGTLSAFTKWCSKPRAD